VLGCRLVHVSAVAAVSPNQSLQPTRLPARFSKQSFSVAWLISYRSARMLTLAKLAVFERYSGDVDGRSRGSIDERTLISEADWHRITALLQQLKQVKKGSVEKAYEVDVNTKLQELAPDPGVQAKLRQLADTI
jgi:hypothetical protein